jgi:hypothetical protein
VKIWFSFVAFSLSLSTLTYFLCFVTAAIMIFASVSDASNFITFVKEGRWNVDQQKQLRFIAFYPFNAATNVVR